MPGAPSRNRRTLVAVTIVLVLTATASGQRGADPNSEPTPGSGRGPGQRVGGPGGGGAGPLGARAFGRGRGDATGTALIRGRVTTQDTGAPVRRAQVRATTGGVPFGRLATTDANGQFELRDLPAGQWSLTASKPGFVSQRLGQRRPFETVAAVEVQDGQQLNGANFALPRGGAITGRLLDDFGDPVANARVQVLRSRMVEGRRRLTQAGNSDETDDTGAFRLYGLAPGDYFVAATLRAAPQDSSPDRAGYAPTYFPGTGNAGEAQRVRLGIGEEQSVSFSLLPVRTVRISGTVVSAAGPVPSNGVVALTSAEGDDVGIVTPTGGQIQANGAFTISNAVPGSYVLSVRTGVGRGAGPRNNPEAEVGSVPLVVGGDDVTGVTVVTTRGASLEGTVVADTGARPPLDNVRVTARPLRASAQPLGGRTSQSPV
ncbi:MAG TPA: carboxypeptidase-like regulatory domain-containing protein, partial [Vicinamibacterales bacterium]